MCPACPSCSQLEHLFACVRVSAQMRVLARVHECERVCVRTCVRACVCVCVCAVWNISNDTPCSAYRRLYTVHRLVFPAAVHAGKLISYWNMPHFSFSTLNSEMANDATYSTLIRLLSPHNRFASFLIEFLDYYDVSTTRKRQAYFTAQ